MTDFIRNLPVEASIMTMFIRDRPVEGLIYDNHNHWPQQTLTKL